MAYPLPAHAHDGATPASGVQELDSLRARALARGVNPLLYWSVRALLQPLFFLYFRMSRIGREHLPRRGPLILETGAPVAPVAVLGTEDVRRGWRIRPRKVRLRVARPLRFPRPENATPSLAAGVTERIWACVSLQWEWLGGEPAPRQQRP